VSESVPSSHWEIPAYEALSLRPRAARYALCVFVINEGERIQRQLAKMGPLMEQIDVILCDGGSSDDSLLPPALQSAGVRALLTKRGPGKLSAQMRMGLSWCLLEGYDGVIVIDGNDKDDSTAVPQFIAALERGGDHVQGSRYVPGGQAINTPMLRHVGVQLLHAPLIAWAAGFPWTDTTNGFRAYSRAFLLDPRVQPFRDVFSRYELHYYLAIRAARLGFSCAELPVTRSYPAHGPAPTKISPWTGNALVLKTLFQASFGYFDPKPIPSIAATG
jgi:dolichol-phosphate mannosyltransferase